MIATDEPLTEAEAIYKHFKIRMEAVENFRQADASERIKKALKSRVPGYNDEFYSPGDKIYVMNEKKK